MDDNNNNFNELLIETLETDTRAVRSLGSKN